MENGMDVEGEWSDEDAGGDGFTLEEVLRLGGTKQDYVMLAGLQDTGELLDSGKKGEIDDLEDGELKAFIEKLGIQKITKEVLEQDDDPTEHEEKKKETKISTKEKDVANKGNMSNEIQNRKDKEGKEKSNVSKKERNVRSVACKSKGKPVFEFTGRSILLLKPGGKWYDHDYAKEFTTQSQNEDDVQKYKALAEKLYEHEVNLYNTKKELSKGANTVWMKTVVSTGTLADRMAAMIVLIQDAPVHTLQFVENLVSLIRKKGSKRQNIMALDTFKDLLQSDLLPDNRKLHTFVQHPFDKLEEISSGNRDARDRRLILWYFEEQLKSHVAEFVKVLETLTHDSLIATKAKSLNVIHEILCNKPEEEKTLLVLLVNKLGDPQYRVATKASYLLEMLLNKHPNMKVVVCLEVERLLYRPNIEEKAQYYGICFLNQMMFSHEESDLANQLITVYFCFFRACIKKKEIDTKILRALLTGVNRAYPYANIGSEKVKEQLDTLFKILHVVNFNTGVQILMLLFQVMDSQQTVSNRYFAALYRKLLDPGLSQGSKQTMFLNLLFKSMKADVVLRRVKAFVKRLLQVTCGQKPSFICGALYLVSEIFRLKPGLKVLLHENGENDEEEHFYDLPDDDNNSVTDKDEANTNMNASENLTSGSWVHQQSLQGLKSSSQYDPMNRNPSFCGADNTSIWELKKLSEHFHPSVALFAKTILEGNSVQYMGDPLEDFTLMRFLDRFVYRNPKQQKIRENRGYLMHQKKRLNQERQPVNSATFLGKEESEIPVDEIFFHRYFKKLSTDKWKPKRNEDEESLEDVDDDEFERILDSYEGDSFYTGMNNDLDFAGNVRPNEKSMKKSKVNDSDSDWDDDDDDAADDDDISLASMGEEDFKDDETAGIFMDTSETSDNEQEEIKGKKRQFKEDDMLAAAEEFGDMLDDNTGSKFDNIGINAVSNKENASIKQLKWEEQRNSWVHNKDAGSIIKKKKKFKQATNYKKRLKLKK
ncbi:CCAAT/enhancer-binding protein zeta [Bufo gargarizans]|uniref:CCAAT/enhancer-binding protein zeta n=1 Tax=Bufo gargarizans TaxID=30331 RepID=UPI001CF4814E|nr:CCAAT/enhancer-binding protein zeta [Bufo gargarizans]